MTDRKKIDFSAKKNEAGWQDTIDTFLLGVTPKLYEWLRWVIRFAALTYVQHKTNSKSLSFVINTTYTFTIFNFIA